MVLGKVLRLTLLPTIAQMHDSSPYVKKNFCEPGASPPIVDWVDRTQALLKGELEVNAGVDVGNPDAALLREFPPDKREVLGVGLIV